MPSDSVPPVQSKPRPRHSRTRAGCLTCRLRKKKCDQAKPRCAGCRRNMLPCNWPTGVSCEPGSVDRVAGSAAPLTMVVQCGDGLAVDVPPPMPAFGGDERACALTPQSVMLLSHYVGQTASYFAMRRLEDNPFVTVLLPLGYMDDLLMHAMLAFSGAHLTCKESSNLELANATRMHYSKMISGLRNEFATLKEDDLDKTERLLRVLLVACHYEAVSGATQSVMFTHLRASSQLISSLLSHRKVRQPWYGANIGALGFSIEMYSYLVLCNTIVPYGRGGSSTSPLDAFVVSLEEMASFPTFGALFAGSHDLYRLVGEVNILASRRLAEEMAGELQPTAALEALHDEVLHKVATWKMPPLCLGEDLKDWEQKRCSAEAFRHSLHIYLLTALCGSIVSDPKVMALIQQHVIKAFGYGQEVAKSQNYVATILWPLVIAGACLVEPDQQQGLVAQLHTNAPNMRHMKIMMKILQLLWDDPDPRAFGPYGLYLTMEKHSITMCIV